MLKLIVITALALYGSRVLWLDGMILEKPKKWLDKAFGDRLIKKPLYSCPPCMASVWGSAVYWLNIDLSLFSMCFWPVFCIATTGLTYVLMYQFPYDD